MGEKEAYAVSKNDAERLVRSFTYHVPTDSQVARYVEIRTKAKIFAEFIVVSCPPSREASLALTHLEETVMWANAAIARNEKESV